MREAAETKTPDELLEDYSSLQAARRRKDEGNASVKAHLERMKSGGVDIDALKFAEKLEKVGGERAAEIIKNTLHIAGVLGIPIGTNQLALDLGGGTGPTLTESFLIKRRIQQAENQGYSAALNKEPRDNNSHGPGSEEYTAWDKGWLDGKATVERLNAEKGIEAPDDTALRPEPPAD